MQITPDAVLMEARKFLKVPFAHRGRSNLGLDCMGLVIVAFRKCGVFIPSDDGLAYSPKWWMNGGEERLLNHFLKYGFEIVQYPQKGDVLMFRLFSSTAPAHHCGFFVSDDLMLHVLGSGISNLRRTRLENMGRSYNKRLAFCLRYKEYV